MKQKSSSARKSNSQLAAFWIQYRRNKLAMVGLVLLILLILVAIFASVIVDYDTEVIEQHMAERLQDPSREHWLGTDQYGRDLFARVIYGTRISLSVGTITVIFALLMGTILGATAGYFGGWVDNVIMRIMDVFLALPQTLLAVAVVAAFGIDIKNLVLALSIAYTPWFARIIRASVLTVGKSDFIEAAKCCGTSNFRIIWRHVLPNALGPIIVQATLQVGLAIIAIASMSFIGLGIIPPTPEWGSMLSESKEAMRYHMNLSLAPGMAILITVLSINLVGDGLRDALDPRLKR